MSMVTRADLLAMSPLGSGQTIGQRAVVRMQAGTMPAAGAAPTPAELAAFQAWVTAGSPAGSCTAPTTCTSNSHWTAGSTASVNMTPGLACIACHTAQAPTFRFGAAGTVFGSAHEADDCNAAPPTGATVELLDATGAVVLSLPVRAPSGNFFSATMLGGPYTARVSANGRVRASLVPQTDGDCNSCHTEQGANGAPGRITWP